MARKQKRSRQAQLRVRLPETLRYSLERAARLRGHSMNSEIVRRLTESVLNKNEATKTAAEALLNGLPAEIADEIAEIVLRRDRDDRVADYLKEMADDDRYDRENSE
jgi:hypothetical protein